MLKVDEEDKRLEAEVYDELEVELDRLEMYDDLGAPASLESGAGLSAVNIIAGPASIGDAVITYPDVLMSDAQNLVHYRGFKFRGRSEGEQGAGNNNLDRNDDLGEPVSPLQLVDGGLSRTRMSTIGEQALINHPGGAPTSFRQKDEQGAENESVQNDGDLSMGSRDLSQQSYMSRSIFSLSLFSGERSNASPRSLGGGSGFSNDEP